MKIYYYPCIDRVLCRRSAQIKFEFRYSQGYSKLPNSRIRIQKYFRIFFFFDDFEIENNIPKIIFEIIGRNRK